MFIIKWVNNKYKVDVEMIIKDEVNKFKGKVIYYKVMVLVELFKGVNLCLVEFKVRQVL